MAPQLQDLYHQLNAGAEPSMPCLWTPCQSHGAAAAQPTSMAGEWGHPSHLALTQPDWPLPVTEPDAAPRRG